MTDTGDRRISGRKRVADLHGQLSESPCVPSELSPNFGDGRGIRRRRFGLAGRRVGGDFDPVGEPDTLNELGQLVVAIEPPPAFLRRIDELEHHGERRLVRQAALRADRAVPHGGEGALDRVRGPQVFPVFGREVVEGEQGMAILRQAARGLFSVPPSHKSR